MFIRFFRGRLSILGQIPSTLSRFFIDKSAGKCQAPRSLFENRSRSERKLIWARFFINLRRIVVLFDEN